MDFRIAGFAAMIVLAGAACRTAYADEKPAPDMKIGMLQGMFKDIQPAMVTAMAKPFRELIFKQTGLSGDVELCPDALNLIEKLKDKKVDLGVFHGHEFAWAQKKCPDLIPVVVTMPPGGKAQAMLVVAKDCKATSLADLPDEAITMPRGTKAYSLMYLEKIRATIGKSPKPQTKLGMTSEDLLNAVVLGEASVALVDASSMDGYQTLNPGAFKHLKILCESEQFPQAVVAYRKGLLSDEDAAKLRTGLATANKTPSGKLLMTLWNLKGLEEPPADYQQKLDGILKSYPLPEGK